MYDHGNGDDRWERGWRRLQRAARQFGRGNMFGPGGFDRLGEKLNIGRMLASGDVRLVALFLIEQQPRHGYDLIKAIEEKSQGFYSPSPGIVYPALTFLEEAGYVTSAADGNKKLYTITDEGRRHLDDNRDAVRSTLDFLEKAGTEVNKWRDMARDGFPFSEEQQDEFRRMREHGWPHHEGRHGGPRGRGPGPGPFAHRGPPPDRDMDDVIPEVNEARRELKAALREAGRFGPDEQRKVADILRRAAGEVRQAGRNPDDDVDL